MGFSKAQLLARLQELQIDFSQHEHPVVLTVEAQAKYVGHLKGGLSKNLFLKDKKQRFYIVSALADTKVDLKVLSRRLGLGKGGLRMAPEESLSEILQVPLGCVTPFALVNDSARTVSLLLDQGFKSHELCFFHPLSNDMSIALNARELDKFLTSIGITPAFVDLEDDPTIGKDQPPDLAALVPSEAKVLVDRVEKPGPTQGSENKHVSVNQPTVEKVTKAEKPSSSKTKEKSTGAANVKPSISYAETEKFVEEIFEMTESMVLEKIKSLDLEKTKSLDLSEESKIAEEKRRVSKNISKLRAELQDKATMFKNHAYTEGFKAGTRYEPYRL